MEKWGVAIGEWRTKDRPAGCVTVLIRHYRVKSLVEMGYARVLVSFTLRGIVCAPPCYVARTHRMALA
jgi:hypothetical protein